MTPLERLYLAFSLVVSLVACSSERDAWIRSVDRPLDTGSDHWRDVVVKRGW